MESMTSKQLADQLTLIASALSQNGDAPASVNVIEAVSALKKAVPLHGGVRESAQASSAATESGALNSLSSLSAVVEKIKASSSSGKPISKRFRDEVDNHDKTRCVAAIVFEDLWNGFDGWKPPGVFWDMVIYVWRRAPEFFEDYDPDREIVEEQARWSQRYFDEQRNYLRHNFCLKRLCHLVMVYEYLHGAEAAEKRPSPTTRVEPRPPFVSSSQSSRPKRSYFGGAITIGCLILVIVVSTILIMGRPPTPTVSNPPEAGKDRATGQVDAVKKTVPENTEPSEEGSTAKAPAQDELKEPIKAQSDSIPPETEVCENDNAQHPESNDVTNTSIALQKPAPETEKAPVHRANAAVIKE